MPKFQEPIFSNKPLRQEERAFVVILLGIVLALVVADMVKEYEPVKLGVLLFPICWAVSLALHQLGQRAAAKLTRRAIERVVIGFGRGVVEFTVRGTPVGLRVMPVAVFTSSGAGVLSHLAGPVLQLTGTGLIIAAVGADDFFHRGGAHFPVLARSLASAFFAGAVLNLLPMRIWAGERSLPNDGLGILRTLRGGKNDATA